MTQSINSPVSPDTRLRMLLFGLLLAAYMLVYTGQPGSIDGQATLAVTSSFLNYGTPDIIVLGSAEALLPPLARMGSFGVDGLLYSKKGVTPSLFLIPLVALADAIPFLPVRAAAVLLNPIITALTAVLIYTLARWLGCRPRSAFISGLVYGLGTFAIVYTTSLFGEPLAALLLLLAVMAAWRYRQHNDWRTLVVCGVALGLLPGINLSYAVMAPLIGFYIFGLNPRRWRIPHLAALTAPFVLSVLLLMAYNGARFGSLLESGYNFAEGEGFTVPFEMGLFGLLVSPYRGVVWYNPVLMLAVPGALLLWRQKAAFAGIILALVAVQIITYASWWSWHGGVVWGPRFLVPVTPLLVLCLLPVIELIPRHRLMTLAFGVLVTCSFAVQAVATLFSFLPHVIYLYEHFASTVVDGFFIDYEPEVIFRWDVSPVIAQFRLALSGEQALQPALFKQSDGIHMLLVVGLLAAGFLTYHYTKTHRQAIVFGLLMVLATPVATARQGHQMNIAQAVRQELMPADLLIAASTSYNENLLDLKTHTRVITTNAPTSPDDPLTAGLWDYAMQQSGLAWFITWFPPASAENWQEQALWEKASFVRETIFRENRALLFDLNPTTPPDQPGGWQFGPILLSDYGIQREASGLRVTLNWQARTPPEQNLAWFVHLVDANGQIIQQQDRAPQGGYAPTSTWEPDQPVSDYLFFPLNAEVLASELFLRIGWVDPISSERLPLLDPAGDSIPDGFILLPVP